MSIVNGRRPTRVSAHSNKTTTLLTDHDVAAICNVSIGSVRRWRLRRCGPRYLRIGASVRYRPEDISVWLISLDVEPQATARPRGGSPRSKVAV